MMCTYLTAPLSLSSEVPLVLYLFLLVSLVWLWAGLHMGYKQLWMLILYVIFNCLLVSCSLYCCYIEISSSVIHTRNL